jgi:hypothetical protein
MSVSTKTVVKWQSLFLVFLLSCATLIIGNLKEENERSNVKKVESTMANMAESAGH